MSVITRVGSEGYIKALILIYTYEGFIARSLDTEILHYEILSPSFNYYPLLRSSKASVAASEFP